MIDRRYPNLRPVQHSVPPEVWRWLSPVITEVRSRTGCSCAFSTTTGDLYFYRGEDAAGGVWSHPLFRNGTHIRCTADEISGIVNLANVPEAVKDQILEENHRADEQARANRAKAFLEEIRRDALDYIAHRHRELRGVPTLVLSMRS
jgi:hypothetical protein